MKSCFYDGTKLLSLNDLNGVKPEIYLCETNRTGGKTTWFGRLVVNRYKKFNKKFALLYRFNYELDGCAENFFKDIQGLFFQDDVMTSERRCSGIYHELFLNGVSCGYAISLNSSDQIRKLSHKFSDVDAMLFDEFQSETEHYCTDEIKKFMSVHTSIARGQGKQVRYVPVYMLSNTVSMLNPYYVEFNISGRLKHDTKFLKGDGYVLEHGFVESASKAQLESGFNRAFSGNKYLQFSAQNVYLNDSTAFIEKPKGESQYLATLKVDGKEYAIRQYAELGIIYCDDKGDSTFRTRITVTTDDHEINYVMLRKNDLFITNFRFYFEKGCFRFKNLACKEAILKTLSY